MNTWTEFWVWISVTLIFVWCFWGVLTMYRVFEEMEREDPLTW